MSSKKILMTATAGAAIAATFVAADKAEASTYKVQSGDSLWLIAQKHNISVSQLKSLNNLTRDLIHPNQVLRTNSSSQANTNTPSSNTSSSNNSSTTSSSQTYTVKAGDSLSKIAAAHKISLTNLMKWNNLSTTLIYPGDRLNVGSNGSTTTNTNSSANNSTQSSSSNTTSNSNSTQSATYRVKSGDTLSHIAKSNGVSVSNLKSWNGLRSDMIYVGQTLKINGSSATSSSNNTSNSTSSSTPVKQTSNATNTGNYNVNTLISTAKSMQGVPYVWGGQSPSGFDCSGFIHYAYNAAGKSMGRTSSTGYFNRSYYVTNPQVGDLVFFENTYQSGISHLGIYLGNGQFIHAGGSQVHIASVNNSYWKKHFHGYKRFY